MTILTKKAIAWEGGTMNFVLSSLGLSGLWTRPAFLSVVLALSPLAATREWPIIIISLRRRGIHGAFPSRLPTLRVLSTRITSSKPESSRQQHHFWHVQRSIHSIRSKVSWYSASHPYTETIYHSDPRSSTSLSTHIRRQRSIKELSVPDPE